MTSSDLPISVIVPVYNGAGFLAEAIAGVRAQDSAVAEIIVIDDSSTDGSGDLAETLGSNIRVLRHGRNMGPAAARNCGITAATGAIIGFLDVDDLWTSDATSLLLSRMQRPSQPAIAAGRIKVISGPLPFGADAAPPLWKDTQCTLGAVSSVGMFLMRSVSLTRRCATERTPIGSCVPANGAFRSL
jgi:glycosyltransferase involved in cell wall biosynthesis